MEPPGVAQRYFDAWNRRDPEGIAGMFAEGGTYTDPAAGPGLVGPAIARYARTVFNSFPDLSFELHPPVLVQGQMVAARWTMRGTNTGALAGNPPTGRAVALPGADFIVVADGGIRSVHGFFDQRTFVEQLGLHVSVLPTGTGPVSFGTSTYFQPGNRTKPGAMSLTAIQVRSDEEAQEIVAYTRRIMRDLPEMPGFISFLGAIVGHRLMTITAWKDPQGPAPLLRGGAHREAMERFFGPDFALGGVTSLWIPHHMNEMHVRCTACGRMQDATGQVCACGQRLPEPPPYW